MQEKAEGITEHGQYSHHAAERFVEHLGIKEFKYND